MRRALHDPEHGYYARHISRVGQRGDFTTAAMVSERLARAVARWATSALTTSKCRHLIEIGPGEGRLAAAVIKHLPWHVRWKTRLHLVETSAPLTALQKKLLGSRATWHTDPAAALAACDGQAVIFSNELVDAFPVRRFQRTVDGWCEMAVAIDPQGRGHESLMPMAPLPDSSAFEIDHPPGQVIEVHDAYRRWLLDWLPLWTNGRMLTIDYGNTSKKIYDRRPHGTVRGYFLHHRIEGNAIYQNMGRQDLTADVNFSDLLRWGAPWLGCHQLSTLGEFLASHSDSQTTVDSALTDPDGAGGAFMVLDQSCTSTLPSR